MRAPVPAVVALCGALLLGVSPARADVLLSGDGPRMSCGPDAVPPESLPDAEEFCACPGGGRVGSLISAEEVWELPIGVAFFAAAAYGVHVFMGSNDDK